ncbi:MAG TPA: 2-C-methyl-D-erythritol 4-phosphate cytidylyltransferase, partial [Armatimonadota bacterium]|nr:2-C-methyl-D-erythritol 4-phosphate cytidylyltransferase [Armatimonadota bacterium]
MGADQPKQFLPLLGEPVLLHTLRRFADPALGVRRLVVVLPADQLATWQALCARHAAVPAHELTTGGATRWASVRRGLALLAGEEAGTVAVHDGVRPLTPASVIEA